MAVTDTLIDIIRAVFNGTDKLRVDASGSTSTVSGTVTADQGTPAATANAWPTKLTDGTDTADVTAAGALKVDGSAVTQPVSAASLPLPSGAATSANQTTEITSLQLIDDIPHSQNAALSKGVPIMGQLDDTATTAATEDNVATIRITAQRAGHVNPRDNSGNELFTTTTPGRIREVNPSTSSVTSVAGSASSVTLLASNSNRRAATFYNDSTSRCFLKMGATASSTSFTVRMDSQSYYEIPAPVYTGVIDGIWNSAVGSMRITEIT